ncbi:ras-related protein Rab-32-like [Phyllopteryx taeniolatus]|uniref:ras-related protein Rab-32-like n=1 Tax=Phyllopteryx taeniolatus TaxID=161469 RepID=UPI002AD5A42C|nr:ras-related protein Rab-32-like [Phyllopteryx taeniolatus]
MMCPACLWLCQKNKNKTTTTNVLCERKTSGSCDSFAGGGTKSDFSVVDQPGPLQPTFFSLLLLRLPSGARGRTHDNPSIKSCVQHRRFVASMAGGSVSECKEYLFKVLVIGELGVGKTSIIKRYVHQLFSQHYRATIGVDFALKVLHWDSKTLVRLQLWDIAGQERFGNMTRVYYKEAVGAFVVFDVTRGSTFEAVSKWKHDLDSKVKLANGSPIPSVLLANKCDQKKEGYNNTTLMDNFCKETGFLGWFETSAKDNVNVDEAAKFLVENILANDKGLPYEESNGDRIKLDQETVPAESKPGCC